jgi:hypothetical protein
MGTFGRIASHVDSDLWNLPALGLGNGRRAKMIYVIAYFLAFLFLEYNQYSLDRIRRSRKRE